MHDYIFPFMITAYVFAGTSICFLTHKIYKETLRTTFVLWGFVVCSLPFMLIAMSTSDMMMSTYKHKLLIEDLREQTRTRLMGN